MEKSPLGNLGVSNKSVTKTVKIQFSLQPHIQLFVISNKGGANKI